MIFVGPPGCGKTTLLSAFGQYMTLLGRNVVPINLDPGNDNWEKVIQR